MRKIEELTNPASCMNKAADDEMVFVLRAKDPDAPGTIRDWINRRIRRGKNKPDDEKMLEAEQCAVAMEKDSPKSPAQTSEPA